MFWTPAFAGVTLQETFYETITIEFCKIKLHPKRSMPAVSILNLCRPAIRNKTLKRISYPFFRQKLQQFAPLKIAAAINYPGVEQNR
jgi:hypothetical protein